MHTSIHASVANDGFEGVTRLQCQPYKRLLTGLYSFLRQQSRSLMCHVSVDHELGPGENTSP
jgi:hypothetical protein